MTCAILMLALSIPRWLRNPRGDGPFFLTNTKINE
jgi:hypothetical protein